MIKFAKKRYITPAGSGIRTTYQLKVSMKTGQPELVVKGKEDWQAYIQSFAESCDITNIIRRINAGELDLLNANPGIYGDFSGVPQNMQEALQIRIDSKNTWANLSDEQRELFGSFDEFCETAGSVDWLKKFGVEIKEESEVNADGAGNEQ